jgi:hypothetical protein
VDFFNNTTGQDLGSIAVNGSGHAVLTIAALTNPNFVLGPNSIAATYTDTLDSTFAGSAATISETVKSPDGVGLQLTGGGSPSVYSESLTFTATVTPSVPGAPTPTGSVSFYDGATLLTKLPLPSGSNQVGATISNLAALSTAHNIVAKYSGDSFNAGGTSNTLPQQVNPDPTQTTVATSDSAAVFGEPLTFTATVMDTTGLASIAPTGSVTFVIDGVAQTTSVTLHSGQASFTIATLSVSGSPHTVAARYSGTTNGFAASHGSLAGGQTISQDGTNVGLTSSANPSGFGQSVTFTATVSPASPGTIAPTGSVIFIIDGDSAHGITVPLSGGKARYTTSTLSQAMHTVDVIYGGNANFIGNSATTLDQSVIAATTTTVKSSLNPASPGQNVTFTAMINRTGATGTVNFYDGSTFIGQGTVSSGVATFTTNGLTTGNHTISARYVGDSNFAASGGSVVENVYPPVASITAQLSAPAGTDYQTTPFAIYGYAFAANGAMTTAAGTATLVIKSAPSGGAIVSGNTSANFTALTDRWGFNGLEFNTSGTFVLEIMFGNIVSQELTISAPGRLH